MHLIYLYTSPSGKHYVGITNSLEVRKKYHRNDKNSAIYAAIRKYKNPDDFQILETVETREEAMEKEIYYIGIYNSFKMGYNRTTGGEGCRSSGTLVDENIPDIMEMIVDSEFSFRMIGEKYGVKEGCIRNIKNGVTWAHITGGPISNWKRRDCTGGKLTHARFSKKDLEDIREKYSRRISLRDIAKEYGVTHSAVSHVVHGRNHDKVKTERISVEGKMDRDKAVEIFKRKASGQKAKQISEEMNLPFATVKMVYSGRNIKKYELTEDELNGKI